MRADDHLKARFDQHRVKRESLLAELATAKRQEQSPLQTITPQKIKATANIINQRLADASPYAKAYLKATVNEISIEGDIVSLSGDSQAMAKLIANNAALEALSEVPRTIQDWRCG